MQQYSQIVIDNLPLMLNQESKAKASVKIASYMNSMLRNAKNEQDLKIFYLIAHNHINIRILFP